jgi:glycosyltransferase involved in cell wall biosynthesis
MTKELFFTIVVPAYNEERYIARTVRALQNVQYGSYEVFVVENGSTDNTLRVAKQFASRTIHILHSARKGVSAARNLGASHASAKCDWLVFLDADTVVGPTFLMELNAQLRANKTSVYGTTMLLPLESTDRAQRWFRVVNYVNRLMHISCAIQLARKDAFDQVRYDEQLAVAEDHRLFLQLSRFGKFFMLRTQSVRTSTRRFEHVGYVRVIAQWWTNALLPLSLRRARQYSAIR